MEKNTIVAVILVIALSVLLGISISSSQSGVLNAQLGWSRSCSDTDGGINTNLKGTVSGYYHGRSYNYTDYCINNIINEYYCDGNRWRVGQYNCPYGCSNGMCNLNSTTPVTYTLTVTKSGSGTITSSPAGINCGSTCSANFNSGTSVTLTAVPATNYSFSGWSGACTGTGSCTVTMNANKSVTATFSPTSKTWWQPTAAAPIHWQWQIGTVFNPSTHRLPSVTVYDIDGFDNTANTVSTIHSWGPEYKVICYIDVGGAEPYRPDYSSFPESVKCNKMSGWNEYWLDIRQISVLEPIIKARFQMCKDKGFDAIEPDVLDAYANGVTCPAGGSITYQDQINYNKKLVEWAHGMGLSIGLKGDIEQVGDLYTYFDWALNEECNRYNECFSSPNSLDLFVNNNKAVFNVEYRSQDMKCSTMNSHHINSMLRNLELTADGIRQPCIPDTQNTW
ncbi:MAG: endo alpha-1,4 polygalactosaminidase [Candidatus Aenigmatarchaeota archaeon]